MFKNTRLLKAFMKRSGVAFNKRLGQNFLMNHNILTKIVKMAAVENCGVLEVGAGLGNLTEKLVGSAKKVVAVEVDSGLFNVLKERFLGHKNLSLYNNDVLKMDLRRLFKTEFEGLAVKVCANLPYYITSSFVACVLEQPELNLKSLTIMVQKEAALRLCALPGTKNCSAISCLVHYYSEPEVLFEVARHNFCPQPKVDSCVVSLKMKDSESWLKVENRSNFFKFVRAAFSQRRKVLVSPLSKCFNLEKDGIKRALTSLGLSENARAQELELVQLVQLFNRLCDK